MTSFYISYLVIMTICVSFYMARESKLSDLNTVATHPGSIVIIFSYLYCVIPTMFFLTNTVEGAPFRWYDYSEVQLCDHLLRGAVFLATLIITLSLTKKRDIGLGLDLDVFRMLNASSATLMLCLATFILVNLILTLLSAPVDDYYSFYTRFDHLSGLPAIIVSICKRLSWGLTPIIICLISIRYKNSLKMYVLSVGAIVLFLILNSYGARIEAMLAIIQATCFRAIWAKRQISIPKLTMFIPVVALALYIFKYIEIVRLEGSGLSEGYSGSALLLAPGEFFALLFPSIELYDLQAVVKPHGWDLYFKDVLSVIPFFDNSQRDFMYWYWQTFVPTAPVAPYTLGVLADPAILGDWWLLVEGVIIGYSAELINRLRHGPSVYRLAAFGYLSSVGILVIKYNMLTYFELFLNNFLPAAFVLWLILSLQKRTSQQRAVL